MSQVEKREHRRSYVSELCEFRWVHTAGAAAAVVPLPYCADAFDIQRRCGLKLSLVVFRMARPHNTHTHTRRRTVGSCRTAKTLTSKAYCVIQAHGSSSTQHSNMNKRKKKAQCRPCFCCCCTMTHTRTHARSRTHTQRHRSWRSRREKIEARLLCPGCLAVDSCCNT